jgi:predicted P-loop ATPase/GTPase
MSGLLQNVRLNSYLVPDSVKKIYSDDSGTEYEMKLAIYKNSHSFPEEMSSELEKKTKDIDELTNYLTEKIENSNLLNYSNNGPNKPYHKTTIEYIGEEGSDYVFLIKMKSGYE